MTYRPITDVSSSYRWRLCCEHICDECGEGFSSEKPSPRFCSHECYLASASEAFGAAAAALWQKDGFREQIASARKDAGYSVDPMAPARAKMRRAAKNSLHRCLRRSGSAKVATVSRALGYSARDLVAHIERQFSPGMSWSNYGEWEIDHVRPIASFPIDADPAEVNALSNLRPLWRAENRRKWAHVG